MSNGKAPQNNVFYRNQNWGYPKIVKGEGIYLYDDKGKAYIDACSGSAVANIGHGNKEVAERAKELMEAVSFTHLSRWTVDSIEQAAEKVCSWAPATLNHVYFVSGGSEATETALKMARQYFIERDGRTSKWKVISKWNSYHGNTLGALAMSGITGRKKIYDPLLLQFPKIPQFYHYRNLWGCETLKETSIRCAQALEDEILRHGADTILAFISEPVVGSAAPGVHPDPIYFRMIREICDKYDILWIDDEVMAGFGRTGKKMAIEHYGSVIPDMMACAKGMSCGYTPMGGVIASDKVFDAIMVKGSGSFHHGHTYGGNPVSSGISYKVLEIIEREGYVANAAEQGAYLLEKLKKLEAYPIVGDVRGKGLMMGVELVKNKATKQPFEPSEKVSGILTNYCLDEGIVPYPGGGSADGLRGDHVQITPPITIKGEEADRLFSGLEQAIKRTCEAVL